jgi:teichuronic acid biosynthesis glycosyltransferase TuaC
VSTTTDISENLLDSDRLPARNLRVLIYTSLFPNSAQPLHGHFILERMRHLLPFIRMTVTAPIPYFPPINLNARWFAFAKTPYVERFAGFDVDHPRYVVFPKLGMITHAFSMFLGSLPNVWRRCRWTNYDLIDAHYVYPDGLAALMIGTVLKKPVVVSARGSDINVFPQFRLIRPLVKLVLRRADAVIAVAQALKDVMVDLGCSAEKITVIPNGVDPVKFRPQARLTARQKLELPSDRPIVLSVGNLLENKGFQILIEMASRLRRRRPDLLFIIVGDGTKRSRLEAQIRSLDLQNNVSLVGARPHEELPAWYSAADLFCLASEREGCPNVLLEALACGCPVIATNVGGIREIVTSPSLGILVGRTPEAFEAAIDQALRRQWNRDAIAAHGRAYSWDNVAASLLDVYSGVVARSKARWR